MLEFWQFVFSSFWVFVGTLMLFGLIGSLVAKVVIAIVALIAGHSVNLHD